MSITTPNPQQGDNGDIQLLQTNLGVKLFGKVGGRWHSTSLTAPEGSPTLKFGNSLSDHLSIDTSAINVFEGSVKVASFGKDIIFGANNRIIIAGADTNNVVISDTSVAVLNQNDAVGFGNVILGTNSGGALVTTGDGTAVTEASVNTLVGNQCGNAITTGSYNTCAGNGSGGAITTGDSNTCIGRNATVSAGGGTNQIAIGYGATPNADNEIELGNSSITAIRCQQSSISSLSDERDKKDIIDSSYGLDFIKSIRPVIYTWDIRNTTDLNPNQGKKRLGFIAQELLVAHDNGSYNDVIDLVDKSSDYRLSVREGKLIPVLTKAVQELSAKIDTMQTEINNLKSE